MSESVIGPPFSLLFLRLISSCSVSIPQEKKKETRIRLCCIFLRSVAFCLLFFLCKPIIIGEICERIVIKKLGILFGSFFKIGLFTFGGGYAMLLESLLQITQIGDAISLNLPGILIFVLLLAADFLFAKCRKKQLPPFC